MADTDGWKDSPLSQEEAAVAERAEQDAYTASQNAYLLRRVIVLRAMLNRRDKEIEALHQQLSGRTQ